MRFFQRHILKRAILLCAIACVLLLIASTTFAQDADPAIEDAKFAIEKIIMPVVLLLLAAIGFLIRHFFFNKPKPPSPPTQQATSHGDDSPATNVGGDAKFDQSKDKKEIHGLDPEKLVDKLLEERDKTAVLSYQLDQRDEEVAKLRAQVENAYARAEADPAQDAKAALDAIREEGDSGKLLDYLFHHAEEGSKNNPELWYEALALAFLRSDYNKAQTAANAILKVHPNDIEAINYQGHIAFTQGDLNDAESAYTHILQTVLASEAPEKEWEARAYGNLGNIYRTRGDLDKSEEYLDKSLAICEELGFKEGIAAAYGNLGLIYKTRGDLDKAEEYQNKSLAIKEELGNKQGIAISYGNLGLIQEKRGDLDKAEEYQNKSLAIKEELGNKQGVANSYGNLGLIYKSRGDLGEAEEYHKKSLAINEELGIKRGMADSFGNLGNIYKTRGDLDEAEEYHKKSLAISEELGDKRRMSNSYGNFGNIYKTRGNLDEAEEYHKKSLAISEELENKQGIAIAYGNLGNISKQLNEIDQARNHWERSLALFSEIGAQPMVEKVQSWLDDLPPTE